MTPTNATLIPFVDIEAYRYWRSRRTGPAYFLGRPGWLWRSAMTPSRRTTTTEPMSTVRAA
jgi:hypothetical protein